MTGFGLVWEDHLEELDKLRESHECVKREVKALRIESKPGGVIHKILEGDNYHSLELLEKEKERVDFIYIDPPYNTGKQKSFAYNDKKVGEEDKYKHSKWLSFMSRRLKLAHKLLKDEGIIFISIDENEQAHLKLLMDQIFGEENFLGDFIRKTRTAVNDSKTGVNIQHESTLAYAKDKDKIYIEGQEKDLSNYKNPDKDKRGPWIKDNPTAASGGVNSRYPITNPYTGEVYLPPKGRYWAFSEETLERWVREGKAVFPREKGKRFYIKKYKEELRSKKNLRNTTDFIDNKYLNREGTQEIREIFDEAVFKYPKPKEFIKELLRSYPRKDIVVLDFFAGSGTTGQAVMELNAEDEGTRRFILCTNNEYQEIKEIEIIESETNFKVEKKKSGEPSKKGKETLERYRETKEYKDLVRRGVFEEIGICRAVTYKRNKKVIEGYQTSRGEVEGIPNNLEYYKVELKPKSI